MTPEESVLPFLSLSPQVLRSLTGDGLLLFVTRGVRMFAYGFLSVVLVLYLKAVGLKEEQIGFLLTMAFLGDTVISLWITTAADRIGRKRMLIFGALLMALAGGGFAATGNFLLLVIVATIGVLSPSDKEVGPFLAIEQAALAQTIPDEKRTSRLRLVQPRWFIDGCTRSAFRRLRVSAVSPGRADRCRCVSTARRGLCHRGVGPGGCHSPI